MPDKILCSKHEIKLIVNSKGEFVVGRRFFDALYEALITAKFLKDGEIKEIKIKGGIRKKA